MNFNKKTLFLIALPLFQPLLLLILAVATVLLAVLMQPTTENFIVYLYYFSFLVLPLSTLGVVLIMIYFEYQNAINSKLKIAEQVSKFMIFSLSITTLISILLLIGFSQIDRVREEVNNVSFNWYRESRLNEFNKEGKYFKVEEGEFILSNKSHSAFDLQVEKYNSLENSQILLDLKYELTNEIISSGSVDQLNHELYYKLKQIENIDSSLNFNEFTQFTKVAEIKGNLDSKEGKFSVVISNSSLLCENQYRIEFLLISRHRVFWDEIILHQAASNITAEQLDSLNFTADQGVCGYSF